MGLFFDEAYYYHWSQNIDWGYYSKPPVVAWIIGLTTFLFGVTEFSVKFFSPFAYLFSALFIYAISERLFHSQKAAAYSSVIFITTPLIGFNSIFITTDAGLFLFWSSSMYFFLKGVEEDQWRDWIILGGVMGLGMLSKYTYAALPIGFIAFIALTNRLHYFTSLKCWAACAIGLSLFSLNILWNIENHFTALNHTREISQVSGPSVDVLSLLEFITSQVFIFGVVWIIALAANRKTTKGLINTRDTDMYIACTLWPILIVIGIQALLSRAFANWAGPFIISASILCGALLSQPNKRYLIIGVLFNMALLSSFYHWPQILSAVNVTESKKNSPYFRLSGWRDFVQSVSLKHNIEEFDFISPERDLLAYFGFYANKNIDQLHYWNGNREDIRNHYDLRNNAIALQGNKAMYIYLSRSPMSDAVKERFETIQYLGQEKYSVSENITRQAHLYMVTNFLGY